MTDPWSADFDDLRVFSLAMQNQKKLSVCLSRKIPMSVPCFGLKPNWLSVVVKSGEMHDKM